MKTPEVCPVCFEEVPPRAKACPHCGADERSGWNEDALAYDGLDLPDEAWDEGEEAKSTARSSELSVGWRLAALVFLVIVVLWRVLSRWL